MVVGIPAALVPRDVVDRGILVYATVDCLVAVEQVQPGAEASANGCENSDGVDSDVQAAVVAVVNGYDDCYDDYCYFEEISDVPILLAGID